MKAQPSNSIKPLTATPASRRTRLGPAVGLFFLAPLVGEFLLGNLPITWLWALISLAPLYGGGALLIRETARRLKLGWPGIVLLGLAYAIVEEALVTQSLFNPNYLGLRLLDYGYISSLGIGAWWTLFVLAIHTIWSTAVPIALVESVAAGDRHTPWLGRLGLAVTTLLFALGCLMSYTFGQQQDAFAASTGQIVASCVIVLLLVVAAIAISRVKWGAPTKPMTAPKVRTVCVSTLVLSSLFLGLVNLPHTVPAGFTVSAMAGVLAWGGALLILWSQRTGWSDEHRLAAVSGLLFTYIWYGFWQVPSTGDTSPLVDTIGNTIFGLGALALLASARKRVDRQQQPKMKER